jgi:replication fork protection complex subunit Csm3/Swi3
MDELLDSYDVDVADTGNNTTANDGPEDLGVDEPVAVRRRVVLGKLDDQRLLGPQGIPLLKSKIVPRIRFKGKGHEKRDLTKILSAYQLWAHGLLARANFNDFIYLTRKAGALPSMKVHRRRWIDNEKNRSTEDALDELYEQAPQDDPPPVEVPGVDNNASPDLGPADHALFLSNDDDDDLYDLPPAGNSPVTTVQLPNSNMDDDINDDEIMELTTNNTTMRYVEPQQPDIDKDINEDELQVLAELGF